MLIEVLPINGFDRSGNTFCPPVLIKEKERSIAPEDQAQIVVRKPNGLATGKGPNLDHTKQVCTKSGLKVCELLVERLQEFRHFV